MSSYLSSIFTSTTSRVNSIRKNLLSDEADGDSEDNTHISRILRSYYIEKGRPFPPWLPPDPKAPQPAPVQYIANPGRGSQAHPPPAGSGLSDLWDPPQSQAPAQESLSLRRAGPGRGAQAPSRAPLHGRGESYSSSQSTPYPLGSERPVPSQRGGSYQSTIAQQENQRQSNNNSPLQSPGLGTSADRLKAKLWGASRTSSSSNVTPVSTTSTGREAAPYPSSASRGNIDRGPSYGSGNSMQRGPYDSGKAPHNPAYSGRQNPSYGGAGLGGGTYSDRGRGNDSSAMREQRPYTGASSPWSAGGDSYSGGGDYGGSGNARGHDQGINSSGYGRRGAPQDGGSSYSYGSRGTR